MKTNEELIAGDYATKLLKAAVKARDWRYSPIGGFSDSGPVLDAMVAEGLLVAAYDFDSQLPRERRRNDGWVASTQGVIELKRRGVETTAPAPAEKPYRCSICEAEVPMDEVTHVIDRLGGPGGTVESFCPLHKSGVQLIRKFEVDEIREAYRAGRTAVSDVPHVEDLPLASGRATCRCCGEKIEHGDEQLIFPYSFTDASYNSWTAVEAHVHLRDCRIRQPADVEVDALLEGCYTMVCKDVTHHKYSVYYFFPRGLLTSREADRWERYNNHCLSSASGAPMGRRQAINHVKAWADDVGIMVTKKAINKAFSENII